MPGLPYFLSCNSKPRLGQIYGRFDLVNLSASWKLRLWCLMR